MVYADPYTEDLVKQQQSWLNRKAQAENLIKQAEREIYILEGRIRERQEITKAEPKEEPIKEEVKK